MRKIRKNCSLCFLYVQNCLDSMQPITLYVWFVNLLLGFMMSHWVVIMIISCPLRTIRIFSTDVECICSIPKCKKHPINVVLQPILSSLNIYIDYSCCSFYTKLKQTRVDYEYIISVYGTNCIEYKIEESIYLLENVVLYQYSN